jgi:hypothetical protein
MKPYFDKFKPLEFKRGNKTRYFMDFNEKDASCYMVLIGKFFDTYFLHYQ